MEQPVDRETISAVMRGFSRQRKRSERVCRACGQTFVGISTSALCSARCRKRWQRHQAREQRAAQEPSAAPAPSESTLRASGAAEAGQPG